MVEALKDRSTDGVALRPNSALMEAVRAMQKLTLAEKALLSEYLSRSMQRDIKQEAYDDISWEAFLDMTFGSLVDDPIEMPERIKARAQN